MNFCQKHACCMSWWIWEMLALPLWGWRHGGCPDEMDLSSGNGTITPNQQLLPKCHTFNQCRKSQFYVTLLLPNTFISTWKFIKQVLNFRENLKCKWMSFFDLAVDWPAKRFWAQKARKAVWWLHWIFTLFKIKFPGNIFNVLISEPPNISFPHVSAFSLFRLS